MTRTRGHRNNQRRQPALAYKRWKKRNLVPKSEAPRVQRRDDKDWWSEPVATECTHSVVPVIDCHVCFAEEQYQLAEARLLLSKDDQTLERRTKIINYWKRWLETWSNAK